MRKKWKNLCELYQILYEDSFIDDRVAENLKRICYAPNMGYCSWIFKYKGNLVALSDLGNGHYAFYTAATYWDVIGAAIVRFLDKFESRKTK